MIAVVGPPQGAYSGPWEDQNWGSSFLFHDTFGRSAAGGAQEQARLLSAALPQLSTPKRSLEGPSTSPQIGARGDGCQVAQVGDPRMAPLGDPGMAPHRRIGDEQQLQPEPGRASFAASRGPRLGKRGRRIGSRACPAAALRLVGEVLVVWGSPALSVVGRPSLDACAASFQQPSGQQRGGRRCYVAKPGYMPRPAFDGLPERITNDPTGNLSNFYERYVNHGSSSLAPGSRWCYRCSCERIPDISSTD